MARLDLDRVIKSVRRTKGLRPGQEPLFPQPRRPVQDEPVERVRPVHLSRAPFPEDPGWYPSSWRALPWKRGDVVKNDETGDVRVVLVTGYVGRGNPFAFLVPADAPAGTIHLDGLRIWSWKEADAWRALDQVEMAFEPRARHLVGRGK